MMIEEHSPAPPMRGWKEIGEGLLWAGLLCFVPLVTLYIWSIGGGGAG